jgi:hypothetical protein
VRQEGVAAQAVGRMSKALLFANRSLLSPTVGSKVRITPPRSIFFAKNDLGELYFYFLKYIFEISPQKHCKAQGTFANILSHANTQNKTEKN